MMYPTKSIQFLTMCRWKYADVRREADVEGPDEVEEESNKRELSNKTISHWNEVFRLAVGQEMLSRQEDKKIGGVGTEVEIDESCFGSMKYGRGNPYGHRQCWVLGGKCRQTKECFLEICEGGLRNKEVLHEIIKRRVEEGTTIYTDMWKGYHGLETLNFDWEMGRTTVNHSKNFVNPENKNCYTNGIEAKWREVKRELPSSGRYRLKEYLPIHCWLLDCKRRNEDRFWSLMSILGKRQKDIVSGRWNIKEKSREESLGTIMEEEEEEEESNVFCIFCGRAFKTKQGCATHQRNCEEAH